MTCAGSSLPTSLYAKYRLSFGLSAFETTALFAVYVAVIIPTMLVCGGLSDRWGRRRVAHLGLALAALASGALAFAATPAVLFAGRMLQGAAAGLTSGAATAALADAAHADGSGPVRGSSVSLASLAISVGSASGPLLSGTIAALLPAPLMLPYLTHLLLLLPVLLMRWPAGAPDPPGPWRPHRPALPRAARRVFVTTAATTVFSWSLLGVFLALVPSVAGALSHTANTAVGGGVVALMLICSALTQPYAGRLAAGAGQQVGLGVMTGGLALLVLAAGLHSLPVLTGAAVVCGAGQGIGFTGALTDLTAVIPAHLRGEVLSAAYSVGYLALAVPVLGVGALADHTGMPTAMTWFAILAAPGCLAVLGWIHWAGPGRPRTGRALNLPSPHQSPPSPSPQDSDRGVDAV
ncbi:MFS transporter [Streptomyces sp. HUAS TT7]|uniref:MFS transporter n=1 Tax=Streptomyces sp. HUAS TT7 TaxID=3447507 RepID=UPI003F65D245